MRGRRALAAAAFSALVLLLLLPPSSVGPLGGAHRAEPPASTSPASIGTPALPGGPTGSVGRPLVPWLFTNATVAPSLAAHEPAASPTPISALPVTPPPRPPPTVPTVMTFLTNSTICCVQANFTAPAGGPWAMIVLNYTGQVVGGVYDSSFRAYINQVQVLFGTTPEYGIWYVSQDVTKYSSLINGTFNFTFLLSAATVGGHFLSSVSLAFYPPVAGTAAPTEPTQIVPLFHRVFVSTTTPSVYSIASIPSNVVNATLEMWTYGFGPDEFWYATAQSYRDAYVAVDGAPVVATLPFPYINTGGEDLFAWRPITAVFTISDRPYEYDVTGALGMIEGTHNFTANVSGVSPSSNWLIGGALLLYTNSTAGAASNLSYRFSAPPPRYASSSGGSSASAAPSWEYGSSVPRSGGAQNVTSWTNESFAESIAVSPGGAWNNLTGTETQATHESIQIAGRTESVDRSVDYPMAMDLGQTLVIYATTGGTYPEYGNFTTYFLNGAQEWVESTSRSLETVAGPVLEASSLVDDRFTGGNNLFAGKEELTGPNAALILSITFISSSTSIAYDESDFGGAVATTYSHRLVGTAYQPPGPDNAETVVVNSVSYPLVAAVTSSATVVDVGGSARIHPVAGGGMAPYSFQYSWAPPGCVGPATGDWTCSPTAAGVFSISVTAHDAAGASAGAGSFVLVVATDPTVAPTSNTTAVDVGQTVYARANAAGGTGSLSCRWAFNATVHAVQSCDLPFTFSAGATGSFNLSVTATDTLNGTSAARSVSLVVGPLPSLTVSPGLGGNVTVGRSISIVATVAGGSGVIQFVWFLNASVVAGVTGSVFTFVPNGTGSYAISVRAVDAAGVTAFAGPLIWTVSRAPSALTTSGSGGLDLTTAVEVFVLGILVGGGAAVLVVRFGSRPRPRRPA